jgi:hypothetical protein
MPFENVSFGQSTNIMSRLGRLSNVSLTASRTVQSEPSGKRMSTGNMLGSIGFSAVSRI